LRAELSRLLLPILEAGVEQRLVQQPLVVAGVENDVGAEGAHLSGVRHLRAIKEVDPPQLEPVDAELCGRHVEQVLAGERRLVATRPAVCAAWGLVGQRDVRRAFVCREPVGPGQHGQRQVGDDDAVSSDVSTVVVPYLGAQAQQPVFIIEGRLEPVHLLAGMVGRHEVLGPVLDPLHRASGLAGEVGYQEVLGVELAPDAEASPRVGLLHADPVEGHT
jgi:hypothetical protein